MLHKGHLVTLLMLLLALGETHGRVSIGVALYDVGRLYDTTPSPHYDDSDYTPNGKLQWSEERYRRKIEHITEVIDTLQMPFVVLYGVENEQVVRDIQQQSKLDYSAVHRTLDYYNGLDFALLYYGDIFEVEQVRNSLYYTYIGGTLLRKDGDRTIGMHLTRRGDRLHTLSPPDGAPMPDITLVWGRVSGEDLQRLKLHDPLEYYARQGLGDTMGSDGWYLHNRLGVELSPEIEIERAGIYFTRSLLERSATRPHATYSTSGYMGGYSRHLPQYIIFGL